MKPFWKNTRKGKSKKHSKPSQPKPRAQTRTKSVEEPWKPPMAVPTAPVEQATTPIVQMLESARPIKKEYIPARSSTRKSEHYDEFRSKFRQLLSPRCRPIDIWRDFIVMSACAMSNTVDKSHYEEREKRYLETINKYEKSQQHIFPELYADVVMALDENPEQDFLGDLYMGLGLGNHWRGQFFTPYHLCQAMAEMSLADADEHIRRQGWISILDPACGAGATLVAAANTLHRAEINYQEHALFVGQDIDPVVAMMCYIQLSLLGCPGYVAVGNSLTDPLTGDPLLPERRPGVDIWITPVFSTEKWAMRRVSAAVRAGGQRPKLPCPMTEEEVV